MSLILDALSRAETEKRNAQSEAADLLSPEPPAMTPARPIAPWMVAAMALAAGVLTTTLVFWVVREAQSPVGSDQGSTLTRTAESPGSAQSPNAASTVVTSVAPAKGKQGLVSQPQPQPQRQPQAPAAKTARPLGLASPSNAVSDRPVADTAAPPAPSDGRIAALYAQREDPKAEVPSDAEAAREVDSPAIVEPAPVVTETPVDLDAVLRDVREEARSDGLAPHPVPLLGDLSQQFRNGVPTLMYLRHDFSDRGRSTVLINGQTLAVGQRTRGVEVREVLGDSVILRFQGTEFRLRALNSWVNL